MSVNCNVEIGDANVFEEVPSGATLDQEVGSQGGSHSNITIRAALMAAESPTGQPWAVKLSVLKADAQVVASTTRFRVEASCGANWIEMPNEPVFWDGSFVADPGRT